MLPVFSMGSPSSSPSSPSTTWLQTRPSRLHLTITLWFSSHVPWPPAQDPHTQALIFNNVAVIPTRLLPALLFSPMTPPALQRPTASPNCHLCVWGTCYKLGVPMTPLLRFNWPEWLAGPGKCCNYHYQLRKSQLQEMPRVRDVGRGAKLTCPRHKHHPPTIHMFTHQALQTPLVRSFMEDSLRRHDWLTHWPLVTTKSLAFLPSQEVGVWSEREFNPLIMFRSSWGNQAPTLGAFQKSPH